MANEIQVPYITGRTVYSLVRNSTGQIWNGSAFENYNSSNYALYVIQLVEQGTSGFYSGTFPATITPGSYGIVSKMQVGVAAAETDLGIGTEGAFQWNGTAVAALADTVTSGQLAQSSPIKIYRGEAVPNFYFYLKSSADHITPFTSGVCSGQISRDNGAFTALQSGVTREIGLGFYTVGLTSGDINCNTAALIFTATGISGGTADPTPMSLVLQKSLLSGSA